MISMQSSESEKTVDSRTRPGNSRRRLRFDLTRPARGGGRRPTRTRNTAVRLHNSVDLPQPTGSFTARGGRRCASTSAAWRAVRGRSTTRDEAKSTTWRRRPPGCSGSCPTGYRFIFVGFSFGSRSARLRHGATDANRGSVSWSRSESRFAVYPMVTEVETSRAWPSLSQWCRPTKKNSAAWPICETVRAIVGEHRSGTLHVINGGDDTCSKANRAPDAAAKVARSRGRRCSSVRKTLIEQDQLLLDRTANLDGGIVPHGLMNTSTSVRTAISIRRGRSRVRSRSRFPERQPDASSRVSRLSMFARRCHGPLMPMLCPVRCKNASPWPAFGDDCYGKRRRLPSPNSRRALQPSRSRTNSSAASSRTATHRVEDLGVECRRRIPFLRNHTM